MLFRALQKTTNSFRKVWVDISLIILNAGASYFAKENDIFGLNTESETLNFLSYFGILLVLLIVGVFIIQVIGIVGESVLENFNLPKHASLELDCKKFEKDETEVRLLIFNIERKLDAKQIKVHGFSVVPLPNKFGQLGMTDKELEQIRHNLTNKSLAVWPCSNKEKAQDSVDIRKKDGVGQFCFIKTSRGRNEFYLQMVTIDKRLNELAFTAVGGFLPGKYKFNAQIQGDMTKRYIFMSASIEIWYKGDNQIEVRI